MGQGLYAPLHLTLALMYQAQGLAGNMWCPARRHAAWSHIVRACTRADIRLLICSGSCNSCLHAADVYVSGCQCRCV